METVIIHLKDTLHTSYCIDAIDGETIHNILKTTLHEGKLTTLSFDGIELVIAAFLNTAISPLFKEFEADYLNSHLSVKDLHEDFYTLWNHTMHHTPLYLANKEMIDEHVSTIIND